MNWRRFLRRETIHSEQREELEFYVDATTDEYLARGMDPAEARVAARRKLGNVTLIQDEIYRMNTLTFIDGVWRDVRYALRIIRAKPGFSIPVLLSLMLGIAANVTIFSIVNAVLLRPLPYADPEKLVGVFNSAAFSGQVINDWPLSIDLFSAYEENVTSFREFGIWTSEIAALSGVGEPEQVATVTMTHGVLRALEVHPYLGRSFSRADERNGAQKTAILSYGYWQRRFGGDPHILGRLIHIDSVPYQVIGVMPVNFVFLDRKPDLLLAQTVLAGGPDSRDANHLGIARLKSGVSIARANQDVTRALKIWAARSGAEQALIELQIKPNIHPLKKDVVGDISSVLSVLMVAVMLVLFLVSANVANLVEVRTQSRSREFAVRTALGASWHQVAREVLTESLTLAILGGVFALGLASVSLRLLLTCAAASIPRAAEISIDLTDILFALACSAASSVLFGFIAILKLRTSSRLENTRGSSANKEQTRNQNMLVVLQVGLALVLVIAAGLLFHSMAALRNVNPGFTHPGEIQTVRIFLPEAQVPLLEKVAQTQTEILNKLAALPGVKSAAFASALPLDLEHHNGNPVAVEGKSPPNRIPPNRTIKYISPGLFAALGTQLIAGRDFTWDDRTRHRQVAIVSENMARANWGEPREALGKRIRIATEGPWNVVIGVAESVHDDGVDQHAPEIVYFPGVRRDVAFALRSKSAGTESFLHEIKAAVQSVNPTLPLASARTLNDLYAASMARRSFALVLLGIAAGMALTLAIIGLYGVLAYAVVQRRKEIGIRIALGAEPGMVKTIFFRRALALTGFGSVIGFTASWALTRGMASLLFGVDRLDPLTYLIAFILVLAAAMTASYIPARRASMVDPADMLHSD